MNDRYWLKCCAICGVFSIVICIICIIMLCLCAIKIRHEKMKRQEHYELRHGDMPWVHGRRYSC